MEDGREDSASHDFLEPEISVASTLSIGADREREARDTLHPRTFEDDTGSSSSEDEACRHDQRADLQKMMSRRNFAVVDGTGGLRHRVKSSSRVEPAAAPESHGSMGSGTGHGRRRSSMVAVPEANEASPGDQPQSYQVVDFFRTVNKDAHLLTRMGSDGVQGCGGLVVRVFASCLRRLGLGNPGASVENMAFGSDDPLDFSTKPGRSATADSEGVERGVAALSGEFVLMEEEELEEDDEADEEELSAQKKKVHDLGELPALDWSNASRKLLITILVVGVILFTIYSGWMDECVRLGKFCLREWMNGLCAAVAAYFVIELLAKTVAGFFKWTRLLHTNNKVWIFIKLHKDVSLLIWSAIIFLLWTWFDSFAIEEDGVIRKILGIFLAYTATHIVSELCKVEMAHRYMWRPYLERARASIWSQYVIFMMTDYAMGLKTKDAEGQALALGFTKTKKGGEHLSLYTVGKAIGFVHANALRHPLGPGRPGTDRDGMIDSKTGARLFGGLLFDALNLNFNEDLSKLQPVDEAAATPGSRAEKDVPTASKSAAAVDPAVQLPRPFSQAFAPSGVGATVSGGVDSYGLKNPLHRKLSLVSEEDQKEEAASTADEDGGVEQADGGGEAPDGNESTSTEDADKWPAAATAAAAEARGTGAAGLETTSGPDGAAPASCAASEAEEAGGAAGKHRRSGAHRRGSTSGGSAASNREGSGAGASGGGAGHKGIKLVHLRKMTSKSIALKIMELFEVPPDGVVTRKEFVDRVVDIFVQRRSLQLTLADYEAILTKVGYLLSVLSIFVLFFIAFRILGFDIGSLVLTWLSLGVAFSFLFGSSASAFFESIIFVFVTKAYDVGDPVFFVDDTGSEDWYVVTRINMLTTVFRRWDGQATLIANNLMAKKAIRNQWRSSPYLHHTMISVSADTPMEKLDQMKAGIAAGLQRGRHRHRHGLGGLMPDTVDYSVKGLTDGNRLSLFVCCRQRENSANMGRRFGNSSFFLKLLVRECNRHGISYTLPPQPLLNVRAGTGPEMEALRAREDFLGGSLGGVNARR